MVRYCWAFVILNAVKNLVLQHPNNTFLWAILSDKKRAAPL